MGWLSSGGTAFSYRMSIPVANPLPAGNRFLPVAFPAWYLKDAGKIVQSAYQDVHVTKADGTTELPCALNAAKTALLIDYASMPQGRTTLYVYYGHASASAPTAPTNVAEKGGTLVSDGFDLGAAGASAVSSPWSGAGTGSFVFDHTYPRKGEVAALDSLMEAKLTTTGSGNYYTAAETATDNLSTDGTEIRWWMYCDTTNKLRAVYDADGGDAFTLYWQNNGNIEVLTYRTKTGYNNGTNTTLASYSTGWWQYKVILNWTTQTFRLARRQRVCDAWTYLKASGAADYDIPMRNSGTTTDTGGTVFYVYDGASLWLDDYQYSTSGITDETPQYYYTPTAGLNTLVDSGFEGRTHGNSLDSGIWTIDSGATCTYDNTKGGVASGTRDLDHSKLQVKVIGAAGAYAGFKNVTSMGLDTDWAEYRFWVLHPDKTAGNYRAVVSNDSGTNQAFYLFFRDTGAVEVYTEIAGVTGYTQNNFTQVSTFNADEWWQYRLVFLFSEKRYYLYRRQSPTGAWTALKSSGASDYKIPFRTSAASEVRYMLYLNYPNTSASYVDDIQYQNSPIRDVDATLLNQALAIDANDERTAEDDTAGVWYVWGRHLEATYLDSNATGTYYGGSLSHRAGANTSGHKYHYLLKFFEGALPAGAVASATLNLYLEDNAGLDAETTLKAHRFLTTGAATYARTYVKTGWGLQPAKSVPTWTNRMYDYVHTEAAHAWQTAGAVGTDEVDLDDPDAPSLVLGTGAAVGYKTITLPAAWLNDWLGDDYSQGVLVKAESEGSGTDKYAVFAGPLARLSPVLAVTYTSQANDQISNRKLSSSTFTFATFSTQNRYATVPSEHTFATVAWVNADMKMNTALVSPGGRICLYDTNTAPPSLFNTYTGGIIFGVERDHYDGTFWLAGSAAGSQYPAVAYSREPHLPNRFTWSENTSVTGVLKSSFLVREGAVHFLAAGGTLRYLRYVRGSGWSSATTLVDNNQAGANIRGLAVGHGIASTDVMTGSGELWLNGTLVAYPAFGSVKIGTEIFWYTGKDTGNNKLTGVTRALWGTTAQTHAEAATVNMNRGAIMYSAVHYDATTGKIHVAYTVSNSGTAGAYTHGGYLNHTLSDADGTWKNEAGTTLTLPLDQTNESIVTGADVPGYVNELLVTNEGHVLIASSCAKDLSSYTDGYIYRLPASATSFTEIDLGETVSEIGLVDMGGSDVYLSGFQFPGGGVSDVVLIRSTDGGATWGELTTVGSHTFLVGSLWSMSVSQERLDTVALMLSQHACPFGAVYLGRGANIFTFDRVLPVWFGETPVLTVDRVLPVYFVGYPSFDRVVPVHSFSRGVYDRVVPVAFDADNALRVDRVIPVHARGVLQADRRVPILFIRTPATTYDRGLPILFRALAQFDRQVPIYLSAESAWVREIDPEVAAYLAEVAAQAAEWVAEITPEPSAWERESNG